MRRIALDAMGGDYAPEAPVKAAVEAVEKWTDLEIFLVGEEKRLQAILGRGNPRVNIIPTREVIGTDEEPVKAIRTKKDSSLVVASRLVKEGEAEAVISAGNTGALMTAGLLIVGRIEGIDRPALSPILPTTSGGGVLVLDVGANVDAKPHHLLQYARMGNLYAEKVMGIKRPRIGLLNIGAEEKKGNELTKETFPLLQNESFHFIGNVEPRDVPFGVADVVVCEGFAGNVLLKTMEGTASALFNQLKELFTSSLKNKLAAALLKSSLMNLKKRLDYKEYGGTLLLGLKGAVVKAHGSSDERAFVNAIGQARRFLELEVISLLENSLKEEGREA
ncbi:MAG: phosphate acyltransferase PlsX [Thermicanus sp.]|nr:phosphate acyltransferase PlsX [Thermicanus sp.]